MAKSQTRDALRQPVIGDDMTTLFLVAATWAFGVVAAIAGVLLSVSFTRREGQRFPWLRKLDGRRRYVLFVFVISTVLSYSADRYREFRSATDRLAVVSVQPTGEFDLSDGSWQSKTRVFVSNRADVAVYSVWVEIAVQAGAIKPESIVIELDDSSGGISGAAGDFTVYGDAVLLVGTDAEGREAAFVVFPTLPPMTTRELVVTGTVPLRSTAVARLLSTDTTPVGFVQRPGEAGVGFKTPPGTIKIRGVALKVKRIPPRSKQQP